MRTLTQDEQNFYWNQGYLIVKNVFSEQEIAALATACDKWKQFGKMLARTWRNKNTVIWVENFENEVQNFLQVCPKEMLDKLKNPITLKDSIQEVS